MVQKNNTGPYYRVQASFMAGVIHTTHDSRSKPAPAADWTDGLLAAGTAAYYSATTAVQPTESGIPEIGWLREGTRTC